MTQLSPHRLGWGGRAGLLTSHPSIAHCAPLLEERRQRANSGPGSEAPPSRCLLLWRRQRKIITGA